MASFDLFLTNFETMLVETLVANREILFGEKGHETLLRVAMRFYDPNLLEQNVAHSINRALNNSHTYAYSIVPQGESA